MMAVFAQPNHVELMFRIVAVVVMALYSPIVSGSASTAASWTNYFSLCNRQIESTSCGLFLLILFGLAIPSIFGLLSFAIFNVIIGSARFFSRDNLLSIFKISLTHRERIANLAAITATKEFSAFPWKFCYGFSSVARAAISVDNFFWQVVLLERAMSYCGCVFRGRNRFYFTTETAALGSLPLTV